MISNVVTFARRAIDITDGRQQPPKGQDGLSAVALMIFTLTCFVFIIIALAASYTYGHLIPVLCMIENPTTESYVPVSDLHDADEPPAYAEDTTRSTPENEDALLRSSPVTTSIRATILHLRNKAGWWSRFRGYGTFIIWYILRLILMGMFTAVSQNPFVTAVVAILVETLLAHIHMTWIHIVISEPSPRWWFRRIPRPIVGNWMKIAPAVAVWALAGHISYLLPMLVVGARARQVSNPDYSPGGAEFYATAGQMTAAFLLTIILVVALQIPATVCMVRVAASMLPEEDETIVSFDRTYGGKTTPAIVGGAGKIGILAAWKTFPWESRKRLLILCVKVAAIMFALWAAFIAVIMLEAFFVIGMANFSHLLKGLHGRVN